ncbi:hypothetical protein INT43_001787 [Umbelopsis isabellina]|uniref:Uncharacterized protein n=1 Tax=Mortierella isabellina TaxID=91625 RepID=A0A8H7UDH4_MORIS|nr:hypothetical protein INT43_001787 [Umbelopsis isabellina]
MTQDKTLQNKVAVVTGGARGIGKALVTALVERGAKVVIGDLLEAEGKQLVETLNEQNSEKVAVYLKTDVTTWDDNKSLFKLAEDEFGGVDIACMNAGIGEVPDSIFSPLEGDFKSLDVNLNAVIKGNKVAVLHLNKRGGGVIVNTASVAGFLTHGAFPLYNASKHGVVGWTRSLDNLREIANIRVNMVNPYWVETDIIKSITSLEFLDVAPKVPMATVIEAFMKAVEDETCHGETILALPDGIHLHPRVQLWESCYNKEMLTVGQQSQKHHIEAMKIALEQARARENI